LRERLPYGVTLWASAIALAHEIASRTDFFRGKQVLELGAGTGLPGIIAASLGAQVLQTDRSELAMSVSKRNIELNKVQTLEQRLVDWTDWNDDKRYDWIIGSDILYAEEVHAHLRKIFEINLAPNGRILLSDPFRQPSINFLESLELDGWTITMSKWNIGEASAKRPIGVFELLPPKEFFHKR
jgi:predicted nicotinamide N-methyase